MGNRYLVKEGYYKIYIKDDLESFFMYFDHFSQGVFLPKQLSHALLKKLSHALIRIFIGIFYITGAYKVIYKREKINENAIVIFKNKGISGNIIKLIHDGDGYKIMKEVSNSKIYKKEKNFYNAYKESSSRIKLPKHKFLDNNTIEIEFIKSKSFQRLISEGTYDLNKSLEVFENIKKELLKFYKTPRTLIHGDLDLTNIFIANEVYYLIDYSDSLKDSIQYDLYLLFYWILASFHFIKSRDKTIHRVLVNKIKTANYIGVSDKRLAELEIQFQTHRQKKFPSIY